MSSLLDLISWDSKSHSCRVWDGERWRKTNTKVQKRKKEIIWIN